LMGKVNQVAKVVVTDSNGKTHLLKQGDRWLVKEQSGYDAEFTKVKKLLLGLADLETIESKTSKPENYGRLGVQAVGEAGEVASKQIQLFDKADNLMHTLIVGKAKSLRTAGGPTSKGAIYVRQPNDEQSWLVSGKIELPDTQTEWLNKSIIDLKASRVQAVNIQHADKDTLSISKKAKADENYAVDNFPEKAELKSSSAANQIAALLQNLTFDEVLKRGGFEADDKKITDITFDTFDGLKIMTKLIEKEGKHYIWFDAKAESDDDAIKQESSKLNTNFALWVYQISETNANKFKKKLEDLIKTP